MWKLMDSWKNRILGLILPFVCIFFMVGARDIIIGVIGLFSMLYAIAWGDKVPSMVMASPEQFKEFEGLITSARQLDGTVDGIIKEAQDELERRKMVV
jgi:uncharacterized membrane protein YqaE (UPF0057 family)